MVNKFKSIKTVIAGLYRDLGVNTELNESDIFEWCGESLMLIGAYPQFIEQTTILDVTNHTCKLPNNFLYIKAVTNNGRQLSWNNKSASNSYNCKDCNIPTCCTEDNFYIKECNINTSINCGKLCFTYLGIPVDEEGYPLMPDDVYFDKALKAYCTYMLDKIQFRKGVIPVSVFQFSEKEWLWYVGAAKGSANMPDSGEIQKLARAWISLVPHPINYKTINRR